jgi:uncharacterized integral membrane protein
MNDNKESEVVIQAEGLLCVLLGVLFIGLKLTGHIDWSWWWVTLPLLFHFYILAAVVIGGLLFLFATWAIIMVCEIIAFGKKPRDGGQ